MSKYTIIKEYVVEAVNQEAAEWAVIRGEVAAKVSVTSSHDKYKECAYTPFFKKEVKKYFKTLKDGERMEVPIKKLLIGICKRINSTRIHEMNKQWRQDGYLEITPENTNLIDRFNDYCIYNPDNMVIAWREDMIDICKF